MPQHPAPVDPIADGDPLAWALERIRTRLPQMLARAGADDVAAAIASVSSRYSTPIFTAPASIQVVWVSTGGIGIRSYFVM